MNPLKAKLAAGRNVIGIWCIVPDATMAGALAAGGADFLILDCEHGRWDLGDLDSGIAACEAHGASPIVRAPGADAFFIQRVLDLGADGVLVPQVADADAAKRVVAMAHFPPAGTRGFNPFTRAGRFGTTPQPKLEPGYALTGVLVETPAAQRALDAILALPQLDLVYLGIYDYSVAIGAPGQVDDPRVQAFIAEATAKCRNAGKAVGTTAMSPEQARRLTSLGVNVLLYGADTWLASRAMQQGIAMLRENGA